MKISLALIVSLLAVVNVHGNLGDWFKNIGRAQIIPARRLEFITGPFGAFVNNMLKSIPNRIKVVNELALTSAGYISPKLLSAKLNLKDVKLTGLSGLEVKKLGFKVLPSSQFDITVGLHKINLRAQYDVNVTVKGHSPIFGNGTIYSFLHLPTISAQLKLHPVTHFSKVTGSLDKFHLNITGLWNNDKKSAEISQFISEKVTSLARKNSNVLSSLFKLVPFIIKMVTS